jgi:Domain of unknown function (DUF4252)
MIMRICVLLALLLASGAAAADTSGRLKLPDLRALEARASETVEVTLDAALLGMAGRFLDAKNPAEADVKEIVNGLQGVYVRSYTFDEPVAPAQSDIDMVRSQLTAPGWSRIVGARSLKDKTNVEVYILIAGQKAMGLAVLAIEPREFTIVNIVGAIDLERLHRLEGQLGVPKLGIAK